ncbi:MAG: hypothetical protein U5K79_18585 [Cyclobacteriaceae bacterium]|nr:hypothetical protein [Cyclobacteriaceae bacterium]
MAKGKKKVKLTKGEDLLENPQAIADQLNKTELFLEQNRKMVLIVGGAIAAVVGLYFLTTIIHLPEMTRRRRSFFRRSIISRQIVSTRR